MPIMKPNRLNVTDVNTRKKNIRIGCSISIGTKRHAVARINNPSMIDLLAAAPTKPSNVSIVEIGAERIS